MKVEFKCTGSQTICPIYKHKKYLWVNHLSTFQLFRLFNDLSNVDKRANLIFEQH